MCFGGPTKPDFPRRTPDYVRFENPPIAEPSEPFTLSTGEKVVCSIKYYEYAIVEVQLEAHFTGSWDELLSRVSHSMDFPDIKPEARPIVTKHLQKIGPAVIKSWGEWFHENYLVVELSEIQQVAVSVITADHLLSSRGEEIAQLIRGEQTPLARSTGERMLQGSSLSKPGRSSGTNTNM